MVVRPARDHWRRGGGPREAVAGRHRRRGLRRDDRGEGARRGSRSRSRSIDRHNFHTFSPLLYQVATAGLAPDDISPSLRGIVQRHANVDAVMAEVHGVDFDRREVLVEHGPVDPVRRARARGRRGQQRLRSARRRASTRSRSRASTTRCASAAPCCDASRRPTPTRR